MIIRDNDSPGAEPKALREEAGAGLSRQNALKLLNLEHDSTTRFRRIAACSWGPPPWR